MRILLGILGAALLGATQFLDLHTRFWPSRSTDVGYLALMVGTTLVLGAFVPLVGVIGFVGLTLYAFLGMGHWWYSYPLIALSVALAVVFVVVYARQRAQQRAQREYYCGSCGQYLGIGRAGQRTCERCGFNRYVTH